MIFYWRSVVSNKLNYFLNGHILHSGANRKFELPVEIMFISAVVQKQMNNEKIHEVNMVRWTIYILRMKSMDLINFIF